MQIALLGPLEVRADTGVPIDVGGARLRTLLILLALDPGRVVTNGRLVTGLWADEPPATAANSLQALVSRLRRVLPAGLIEAQPTGYRLAIPPESTDVARFESLVAQGRAALDTAPETAVRLLREADALWRGPALADADGAAFATAPRVRLEELRLAAIEDRVEAELRLGSGRVDLADLEALVAAYPLRERFTGQLMRALRDAGRPADALAAFERLRARLADELGADPSPALTALNVDVLRGTAAPRDAPRRGNLRAPLTSFVGRADEVRKIGKLVAESRLTTLVGPGGAGKTRLAVESARAVPTPPPDGVWLVELAAVTDPAEVPQAVVVALGLRDQPLRTRPMGGRLSTVDERDAGLRLDGRDAGLRPSAVDDRDAGLRPPAVDDRDAGLRPPAVDDRDAGLRLAKALAGRELLLILDNCEHLIEASARLADELLGLCPGVRILATSREPLGITGEVVLPVEPLPAPPPGSHDLDYAALRLLVDRASAVRPGLTADPAAIEPLGRICRALDGMPLAIELAAARLSALTPHQVADRLDDRFQLLTKGSRTALPRHQTLRAVVDWSWELLSDPERILLRRLSVFAGGATAEAAEKVCAGGLDELTALVDKSLLVLIGERFGMLETIRAYGLERLREAGEHERLVQAHTDYFLRLAEEAEPRLRTAAQLTWLARLSENDDNLVSAVRRAISAGDGDTATRFIAALGWYWWLRGHRAESGDLAAAALPLSGGVDPERRAIAYAYAALTGFDRQRDMDEVKAWFATALDIASRTESAHPVLRIAGPIGALAFARDKRVPDAQIRPLFEDPDPWTRSVGRLLYAHTLLNLGESRDAAHELFTAALAGFTELGERWGTAFTLNAMAEMEALAGNHRAAIAHSERSLVLLDELGATEDRPITEVQLATQFLLAGERDKADAMLEQAIRTADRIGTPEEVGYIFFGRAEFARFDGDAERALVLYRRAHEHIGDRKVAPQLLALLASGIGWVEAAHGNLAAARASHEKALGHAEDAHDAPVFGRVLDGFADLALAEGAPYHAAVLLAAADTLRGGPDASRFDAQRVALAARELLGEEAFAEAKTRGSKVTRTTLRALLNSR